MPEKVRVQERSPQLTSHSQGYTLQTFISLQITHRTISTVSTQTVNGVLFFKRER